MTHSLGTKVSSYCGRPNKSRLCTFYPFQMLVRAVMTFAHHVSPWTALLRSKGDDISIQSDALRRQSKKAKLQYSLDRNIAEFEFDWTERLVTVRIMGDEGQILLRDDWTFDLLTAEANTTLSDQSFDIAQHRLESSLKMNLSKIHGDYICVNYRGNINRIHFAFSAFSTFAVFTIIGMCPPLLCFFAFLKAIRRYSQSKRTHLHRIQNRNIMTIKRPKKD